MKKRHRRFGDRKDGRKLRSLPPISRLSPYIMKHRSGSQNFIRISVDTARIDDYIVKKRNEGLTGFGLMHIIIAAYVRAVSQRPALNRFVAGQKVFSREDIETVLTIKKEMTLESPDTVVKAVFAPDATAGDIYKKFSEVIEGYRAQTGSGFDDAARMFNYIPGLLMKFTVWGLTVLDYFGLLPKALTDVSPFHGSFFITSMGSLGIEPVFHHLYDFGTIPVFCAFGVKYRRYELEADGGAKEHSYVDLTFVTDERICDGFYFASALKLMKNLLKNPFGLDYPPKEVVKDID